MALLPHSGSRHGVQWFVQPRDAGRFSSRYAVPPACRTVRLRREAGSLLQWLVISYVDRKMRQNLEAGYFRSLGRVCSLHFLPTMG